MINCVYNRIRSDGIETSSLRIVRILQALLPNSTILCVINYYLKLLLKKDYIMDQRKIKVTTQLLTLFK